MSDSTAAAFQQLEQLIGSFAAVPNPGLYDGRRLFAVWIRQFPIPQGVVTEIISANGLPCMSVRPAGVTPTRTIMHIHGGAFASGNGSDFLALGAGLALATNATVVLAEYRLAPEHPYPAAPDDCFNIYTGLLANGVDPGALAISGDSAGATLVLSTLLRARAGKLPLPAAAAVLSPWVDLSMGNDTYETVQDPTASRASLKPYMDAYLGTRDARDSAISPLFADLTGLPPLLVQVGSQEVFVGEARELAARARAADVPVTLEVADGMPHIWHFFASFLPQGQQAIDSVGSFFAQHFKKS